MPADSPADRGRAAEERALALLTAQGLTPVARNFRCRLGEIDLIMGDGKALVFVEVRYRGNPRFGSAAESVNRRKQQRIITAAKIYLQKHPAMAQRPCRFDVVALGAGDAIEWFKNAFDVS